MVKLYLLPVFLLLSFSFTQAQSVNAFFDIVNERRVGNLYEFDVLMSASAAGTYHAYGLLYIRYNTAAFGDSVVARSRFTFDRGNLLDDTIAILGFKYRINNVIDNSPDRFALAWQANFLAVPPGSIAHVEVPVTPTTLIHVEMTMTDTLELPELSLSLGLMKGQQYYLVAPSQVQPYRDVFQVGLPVEWLDFSAQLVDARHVDLVWRTASEQFNDHFVVERAYETGPFEAVGTVASLGNSALPQTYRWRDQGLGGGRWRYRLRQVDVDGSFSFSSIREVQLAAPARVIAYPNPSRDYVRIAGLPVGGEWHYELFDATGRRVDYGPGGEEETISLENFPVGVYYLRVREFQGRPHEILVQKIR